MADDTFHERLKQCREASNLKTKAMGFTPAEEWRDYEYTHGLRTLQATWREPDCRRDPREIMDAVIDALTQEGIPAWPGDATSCVEQMVRVQYDRAEKALIAQSAVEELRTLVEEFTRLDRPDAEHHLDYFVTQLRAALNRLAN